MTHEKMPDVGAALEAGRQPLSVAQAVHIHALEAHRKRMVVNEEIDRPIARTIELFRQPPRALLAERAVGHAWLVAVEADEAPRRRVEEENAALKFSRLSWLPIIR